MGEDVLVCSVCLDQHTTRRSNGWEPNPYPRPAFVIRDGTSLCNSHVHLTTAAQRIQWLMVWRNEGSEKRR